MSALAMQNPAFAAIQNLKDTNIDPAIFSTSGTLTEVLKAWAEAIKNEKGIDMVVEPQDVTFGTVSGALSVDGGPAYAGMSTRLGYTKHALTQLFSRTNPKSPVGALVTAFLWVRYPRRAILWAEEILVRGNTDRKVVARIATNAHAKNDMDYSKGTANHINSADLRYVRAFVTEGHAQAEGDDSLLIKYLEEALVAFGMEDLAKGQATVVRDPSDMTRLYVDSRKELPNGAAIRLTVVNSEVGNASASQTLSVRFEVNVNNEKREVEITLDGDYSHGRAIHKGRGVSVLFDALHENVMFQTNRAVTVLPALAAKASETSLNDRFKTSTKEVLDKAYEMSEAVQTQGIANIGTLLNHVVVLALMGHTGQASEIYRNSGV